MPLTIEATSRQGSLPIHLVTKDGFAAAALDDRARAWAKANGFKGEAGKLLVYPDATGAPAGALFGMPGSDDVHGALATGSLGRLLPAGAWHLAGPVSDPALAILGARLGAYAFDRYRKKPRDETVLAAPEGTDLDRVARWTDGVCLTRDLINTPTSDMGPEDLEAAARKVAKTHKAKISVITGDALLSKNFPMIHAVGRASASAPRLIDMVWGVKGARKVTLVGKGVCFDTGGLDIKPASGMLLMKKDMGGAANVLGLASMLMAARLDIRLRVLIPAVENSISGNAFRPGDVLTSRKGLTVEVGNTDAEGRLVLADALALADEDEPDLLIDMATLTGAARVALGPDLPAFFTDDDAFAASMAQAGAAVADPVWRMPLWQGYAPRLSSRIADTNNVTADGFAGAITAALFLRRFVEKARIWAHLDVFGWNPVERPHCPIGAEAHAIRALEHVIAGRQ